MNAVDYSLLGDTCLAVPFEQLRALLLAIVLTERPFSNPSDPNWIATVGPMVLEYARRYTAKVAELRKTDLRIDWSEVIGVDGPSNSAPAY